MKQLIRLDWAMKEVLRRGENHPILEGFLAELLGFELSILEVLDSDPNPNPDRVQPNRVDILAKDRGGLILVELLHETHMDYLDRAFFGKPDRVMGDPKKAGAYGRIRKIYTVGVLCYDQGQGQDYLYRGSQAFKGLHMEDELALTSQERQFYSEEATGEPPEHYLIRIPNFKNHVNSALDQWIYFLKNGDIEPHFSARGLQAASERLSVLKLSGAERVSYRRYLDDLHYQTCAVDAALASGEFRDRQKLLVQIIQYHCRELGLKPVSEKTVSQSFMNGLRALEREMFSRVRKKREEAERAAENAVYG